MNESRRPPKTGEHLPAGAEPGTAGFARGLHVSLSPATLAGGLLLLCLGFIGVFCLGIIIGRGHSPEAGIPELARIMPEPAPRSAPTVIAADSPPTAPNNAGTPPPQSAPQGVIEQGQLDYRDHLKSPAAARTEKGTAPQAAAKPQAEAKAQDASKRTGAPSPPSAAKAGEQGQDKKADTQKYRYSYQAASFAGQAPCDAFVAKLVKAGFKCRTEKVESGGKIWFRAMVDFTGRPDDTDALREKLKSHGVPKALLRSKIPL